MNIFFLDGETQNSVAYYPDSYIKIALEIAQMTSTAKRVLDSVGTIQKFSPELSAKKNKETQTRFKLHGENYNTKLCYIESYINHPMTIWCRTTYSNYMYAIYYGQAIITEMQQFRKKSFIIHKSYKVLQYLEKNHPNISQFPIQGLGTTMPPLCMPDKYKDQNDLIGSYRNYFANEKYGKIKCNWTKRQKPGWIDAYNNNS